MSLRLPRVYLLAYRKAINVYGLIIAKSVCINLSWYAPKCPLPDQAAISHHWTSLFSLSLGRDFAREVGFRLNSKLPQIPCTVARGVPGNDDDVHACRYDRR